MREFVHPNGAIQIQPTLPEEAIRLNRANRWFRGLEGALDWYEPRTWPAALQRALLANHPDNLQRLNITTFLLGNGYPPGEIVPFFEYVYGNLLDRSAWAQLTHLVRQWDRQGFQPRYEYHDVVHQRRLPVGRAPLQEHAMNFEYHPRAGGPVPAVEPQARPALTGAARWAQFRSVPPATYHPVDMSFE